MGVRIRARKTLNDALSGALFSKVAVSEQGFKIALNGSHLAFAVRLVTDHGAICAEVGSPAILAGAGESADGARGVVYKGMNVMLAGNARLGKWPPPIGVRQAARGVAIASVLAGVRNGLVVRFRVTTGLAGRVRALARGKGWAAVDHL